MDILKIFAKNLKKYRMQLGLSQEEFAEKTGLHRTYISAVEREKRNISLDNIQKIASALKIDSYQLFLECDRDDHKFATCNQAEDDTTITTMCAIINRSNEWLFIDRTKSWQGLALPGGHLEGAESTSECIRREIHEETGLILDELVFKGIVHFYNPSTGKRYLVFNYLSTSYSGELSDSSDEGTLLWINKKDFANYQFAEGMEKRFDLFTQSLPVELFVKWSEEDGYVEMKRIDLKVRPLL